MKTIKYFFIGALLTIVGAPAMAQVDSKEAVNQVNVILLSKAADADKKISAIAKQFKKDPATLTEIGRSYLRAKNLAKAEEYANMALAKNKHFGNAYILLGDVAINNDNGGKASEMFEQACYMDPQNPDGYRRYAMLNAKSSPTAAVSKLQDLGNAVPGYPWEVEAAEIYDRAGNIPKAIEYYEKVPLDKMKDSQLASYATDQFLSGKFDKSLEIAEFGVKKSPRNAAFNRLAMYNNTEKKNYVKALDYGKKLFNECDSAKFSAFDYQYMGVAYTGDGKFEEAIGQFKKILTLEDVTEDAKISAKEKIGDAYAGMEDYPNAISYYEDVLNSKKDATATDWAGLGSVCTLYANTLSGAEQEAAVAKADKIYGEIADKFPDAAEFAAFQRARVAGIVDPDLKKGAAKPHYDKLIELIEADGKIEGTSRTRILQAYQYNMIYALQIGNDVPTSKIYAAKILELDPENEQAKMVNDLK